MAEQVQVASNPNPSWHRWFRRTNVYIAEYIVMLILVGTLFGLLAGLWFSFFNLLVNDGYAGSSLAVSAVATVTSLLVIAPAAYWMYSRVSGEEMVNPGLRSGKARTVFLTLWLIGVVLTLVGLGVTLVGGLTGAIFGVTDGAKSIVGAFIPALLALPTVGFGLYMVVKNVSRKFVMLAGIIVASMAFVLILANSVMIFVRKDAGSSTTQTTTTTTHSNSPGTCTYSKYLDNDCTYSEWRADNL